METKGKVFGFVKEGLEKGNRSGRVQKSQSFKYDEKKMFFIKKCFVKRSMFYKINEVFKFILVQETLFFLKIIYEKG